MANNKYFDFNLPQQLIDQIEEYKSDPNPLNADLYQDEIRSLSRLLNDESQGEKVIEYFCIKCRQP